MTYDEALSYIHSFKRIRSNPGLHRIKKLLSLMGNPERSFPAVHVAGTNGKGSFCAMLDSVLIRSGYKTGLYTSPYIERFNERMCFCGEPIDDASLADITEYVKRFADTIEDTPTEFDITTAIGFEFFRRRGCDIAIIETGLGGRLDSTNVFDLPLLSVITGISLDHTELLGDTVEKIAYEKAGIIKSGAPVLYGGNDISAARVIKARAQELHSPYFSVPQDTVKIKKADLSGTVFDFGDRKNIKISLLGAYQPYNAANVIFAADILKNRGINITEDSLYKGLAGAKWKARFEKLCDTPLVLYDGSHNAEGAAFAADTIKMYFGDKKVNILMGVMRDKSYEKMALALSGVAEKIYTVTPENPRALSAHALAELFKKNGLYAVPFDDISVGALTALRDCKAEKRPLICLGSLYLYSDFKRAIEKA
ncbi:MAG: bifunctional folylpolyglutamate synthase/dihydrofolate synthase [Eubacteriales bacterium]